MTIKYEASKTHSYIERRRKKGVELNADEIWQMIRATWPGLSEEQHEAIFQACERERKETK
jgi:hypothetical protein